MNSLAARLSCILFSVFTLTIAATEDVPEPAGYRMEKYRDAVPGMLTGATTLDTEKAYALWKLGEAAFVDVLPRAPKPTKLPKGTIWRERPRLSIPGAIWLPNVGYGALADVNHAYFRAGLEKITKSDIEYPVVFFCLEDCWMSWNAAKRALEYGYSNVYWLPEGTGDWALADYPLSLVEAEPEGR